MKLKIELEDSKFEKIKRYVEEERFKSIDDFIDQATKLLIYAEDKKEEFGMILPKTSTKKS